MHTEGPKILGYWRGNTNV